jgi:hypothetical protein
MDDKQKSESIKRLVEDLDAQNVVLPEFQRDFVWDVTKTYDLFDSIVREIFIGSIIYGIPKFEITTREIDKRPRKGKDSRARLKTEYLSEEKLSVKTRTNNFRLILDGQQRVTSIYRALKNIDKVWFIVKNDDELSVATKSKQKFHLEDWLYEFRGQEDKEHISINVSDVYLMLDGKIKREAERIQLFKETMFYKLVKESGYENKLEYHIETFLNIVEKLQDVMKETKLISYYLLDMNTEKFALFFERSNSRGMQLNFIDILAAKLYQGFNLRNQIEEFEGNFPDYKLNREIIVRTISYLVSKGKNVDRAYILKELNSNHFKEYWEKICSLYKDVLDFLYDEYFIMSQSWMPYENMLIPLMIFLRNLPNEDFSQMTENQLDFIHYWYWAAIFSQKYTGSTNETIIQDSGVLKNVAEEKQTTARDFFHKLRLSITILDLIELNKKGSGLYKGVLNLINYKSKGTKDWNNNRRLTFNYKLNDHHIFPKEYIKMAFKNDEKSLAYIDSVINRTLIPKFTNLKIGFKKPSLYLKEIEGNNNSLVLSLKSHCIPGGTDFIKGLYDDSFLDFLEDRAKEIFDFLKITVIDKKEDIQRQFLREIKSHTFKNIKVHCNYMGKRIEATFDPKAQKIRLNEQLFSVSAAAKEAKKELTGKDDTSTNGWQFWKFISPEEEELAIEALRNDQ